MVMAESHSQDTFLWFAPTTSRRRWSRASASCAASRDARTNRLGFAKWLIDPVIRASSVTMNRFWQMLLEPASEDTEDFACKAMRAIRAARLAGHRVHSNELDVKAMQKSIVTSATYRSSSKTSRSCSSAIRRTVLPGSRSACPRWCAPGLFVSGLLWRSWRPFVKPTNRPALKELVMQDMDYTQAKRDLHRRSLYTSGSERGPP